ncbi:MAG: MinD/ParA family protein [Phycisphaerae bacterium]|nr:MinD/ParA family protein [Phycisphaerae bacterium]
MDKTIVDQAEKLRLMVRDRKKTAQILAVTSGKGGVGKTSVAANLAICLRAAGKRVVLVDADLGLANLDVLFNIKSRYNLAHVISGRRHIDEIIQKAPGGVKLVCGASGLAEMAELTSFQRQRIIQELSTLESQADIIIVDTGAGISPNVLAFCESADHTLLVATPEPTSVTDAYAMIKRLSQSGTGVKVSLLVNMAQSRLQAKNVYQRLSMTARKFLDIPISDAGFILKDERVPESVCNCEPVVLAYPRCQASYCFLALASKINRGSDRSALNDGFFKKVVNWFF